MSDEYLMTGCFGLDVDAWQGGFYDDDLPVDWRAACYSTVFRSVLLPQSEWRRAVKENWIDEVDEGFRFILYCSPDNEDSDMSGLFDELSGLPSKLSAQVAGLVVKCAGQTASIEFENAISDLKNLYPLCIDAGNSEYSVSGMDIFCDRAGVSCVWYPAVQNEPLPSGELLVTLIDQQTLPEQRDIVSKIAKWVTGGRRAGLFNTNNFNAPIRAQETRILAELMGV